MRQQGTAEEGQEQSLKDRGHDKAREVGGAKHRASWGRGEEFGLTVNAMVGVLSILLL